MESPTVRWNDAALSVPIFLNPRHQGALWTQTRAFSLWAGMDTIRRRRNPTNGRAEWFAVSRRWRNTIGSREIDANRHRFRGSGKIDGSRPRLSPEFLDKAGRRGLRGCWRICVGWLPAYVV